MHKPESVQEIEAHKILWDFKIKMDHLIPVRKPELILINNEKEKKSYFVEFAV